MIFNIDNSEIPLIRRAYIKRALTFNSVSHIFMLEIILFMQDFLATLTSISISDDIFLLSGT